MTSDHVSYLSSSIHYTIINNGPQPVLCFHGYGEQSIHFSCLDGAAAGDYTFIAIDLPFHGKTEWKEGFDLSVKNLQEIVDLILDKNAVTATPLTLLGFSMGGRIALSLYEAAPARFNKLVLLAPDGLKMNPWFWLATQTWTGEKLFVFTLRYPGWFTGLLKLLNRLHLVNASIFKFVRYYIDDKEVRRLLYARWITLRKFVPRLSLIRAAVRRNKTLVRLVYGKHDRIITPKAGYRFITGIEDRASLQLIDSGHQVLNARNTAAILHALRY